ncbi:MAG: hypothetical protein RLZZ416_769 [Candidatus Parcubacteria bacterium]|jgi:MFS family permease
MIRRYLPKSAEELVHWYERYISPVSLIAGFLADNYILLRRVDLWQSNLLLFSYLGIAALGILAINLIESGRLPSRAMFRERVIGVSPFIPVVVQFSFGGLFSGYLSLYSRSAAFPLSWIFVIALAALLLGNERFVRLYRRFSFQISLYFVVLFSFLIFFLPVVTRTIGPAIFIISSLLSVSLITLYVRVINAFAPELVRREKTKVARSIAVIFIVFNVLYFSNVIPPLPLALKDGGVYHSVAKTGATYALTGEPLPWYESFFRYNTVFHQAPNEEAVAWSAVFAPSGLSTVIFHEWQHYDEGAKEWLTTNTERFAITGGRDGGYRGYSIKGNLAPGSWRVNVVTQYGQVIGRISFIVENVATSTPTVVFEK